MTTASEVIAKAKGAIRSYLLNVENTSTLAKALESISPTIGLTIPLLVGPLRSVLAGTGVSSAFTTQPTIDQLSIWDPGAAVARIVALSTAPGSVDIRGAPLRAPDGLPFSTGVQTLDAAGNGTIVLGAGQIECEVLICTGVLTGTRLLTLPVFAGGLKMIVNATTGNFLFGVNAFLSPYASANGIAYLAPGQTKGFRSDGTNVFGIAPEIFHCVKDVSLVHNNGNVTDTQICLTPPNLQMYPATAAQLVAAGGGGTSTRRLGVTAGGNELLLDYTNPAPPLQGKAQGQLGSDMATDFNAYYGTSVTVNHRATTSVANVTSGTDRVRVIGIVQGD